MADERLLRVRNAFQQGAYRLTSHAEHGLEADNIYLYEIEEAFGSASLELIEDYPDDQRGATGLFLGIADRGMPLHAVVATWLTDIVVVVTLYRPDAALWDQWRRRIQR